MSLITRCPACSTMFKVVPDQLRVSDGWVRCGQCDEVFDANAHLQSLDDSQAPVKQPDSNLFSWDDSLEASAPSQEVQKERDVQDAHVDPLLHEDVATSTPVSALLEAEVPGESDPLDAVPANDLGASTPGMDETILLAHSELGPISQVHSELQPDVAPIPPPNFLRPERVASTQQSRGAQLVVALLCALSAGLLLLQWVVHERDRIAATEPAALAVLEPMCGVLDCRIAPLRQIESVVIDSSSFGKTQTDVYRLGFAIKSTALVDVAVPSLELTLTDAQDKAVVRRVFSPQELGSQRASLASGGEWAGSVPVTVKPVPGAERIAGYRLLAFYP
jgi:predicted Zn finger-like uncharacterized protein